MVVRVCPICDIAECTTHDPERQRGRITTSDELVEREIRELLHTAEVIASEPYANPEIALRDLIKAVKLMWEQMQKVHDNG